MRITIDVRIDSEPQDTSRGSFGNLQFTEQVQIPQSDFSTISAVFTKCHELLQTIEREHKAVPRK